MRFNSWLVGAVVGLTLGATETRAASPPQPYLPITPTATGETVVMNGHDLTIEQVVRIARDGAKAAITPEARQRSAEAYGLLLEAAAEGIQIYRFNRGAGSNREVVIFTGDPMSPENKPAIEKRELEDFKRGSAAGYGPEIDNEETVRAMMAVRANTLTYTSASPQLMQMLLDLINARITPVVRSGGTLGEGDLAQITNIEGAMVGVGEVYYKGVRMPAAKALATAGLKPLQPFGSDDDAFDVTNAYATAEALLMVDEGRRLLEWSDLVYAMDLNGLNSSITPMSMPVQADRPFKWLNWESARILDMIRGSYLFQDDAKRIIQDPESMRASPHRQGAAWLAWANLRAAVQTEINASEQNPLVRASRPEDSWELSTPHFLRYHIKGGPYSNGKSGYVLSNANWDPYPLSNQVEAFVNAVANMDVNITQRTYRFSSTFFTVAAASDVLSPEQRRLAASAAGGYTSAALWQEILTLTPPLEPQGNAIVATVEDLQGQTHLKAARGRKAVDLSLHLLAQDLLTGAYWMEVRRIQDPSRTFGPAPTAALAALRQSIPWQAEPDSRPPEPMGETAYKFMVAHPVTEFYKGAVVVPTSLEPATPWLKAGS